MKLRPRGGLALACALAVLCTIKLRLARQIVLTAAQPQATPATADVQATPRRTSAVAGVA